MVFIAKSYIYYVIGYTIMINKTWQKWTEHETDSLKYHWCNSSMLELLAAFPNRNYTSLMLKAQQLGVKSIINRHRKGSLKFLDELTKDSCYWWGFIIADGHLTSKGELVINLSVKDVIHLRKLAKQLNCKISIRKYLNSYTKCMAECCILRIQDKEFGKKWLKILKIVSPKTYNPPDLSVFLTK